MPEAIKRAKAERRKEILLNIHVASVFLATITLAVPIVLNAQFNALPAKLLIAFLIWISLAVGSELLAITLPRGGAVLSVGGAIDFGIILLFPTVLAAFSGLMVGLVTTLARKAEPRRVIFNSSMLCLTMLLTSTLVQEMGTKVVGLPIDQLADWPRNVLIG